jgi:hypothetical protein
MNYSSLRAGGVSSGESVMTLAAQLLADPWWFASFVGVVAVAGRGLHSSTFQVNLSRF